MSHKSFTCYNNEGKKGLWYKSLTKPAPIGIIGDPWCPILEKGGYSDPWYPILEKEDIQQQYNASVKWTHKFHIWGSKYYK